MIDDPIHIIALPGLGDAIYQRPHVKGMLRRYSNIYLETGFPQIFSDIPGLKFVKPTKLLPIYDANVASFPKDFWYNVAAGSRLIEPSYELRYLGDGDTLATAFAAHLRLNGEPLVYDLPEKLAERPKIETNGRPLAIVRPVTRRTAYANTTREPLWEYVYRAAEKVMDTHHVVLLGNIDGEYEWLVGDLPPHHADYSSGQFTIMEAVELMRSADCLVGGVGFMLTVALAEKIPSFVVLGGNGRYNAPNVLIDSRVDGSFITFAEPDKFCRCYHAQHDCNKTISDFEERLYTWHQAIQHSTT